MVTVSQQFVVIRLIGPDAGFRSQKFHKAGSLTLVEYGRRILMQTMLLVRICRGKCAGKKKTDCRRGNVNIFSTHLKSKEEIR
jgi:hypothetical protein